MRLALDISRKSKTKLVTDVFLKNTSEFLNGVDLSNEEGRKKYINAIIEGKNPFKKDEISEDDNTEKPNININTATPWIDIVQQASQGVAPIMNTVSLSEHPFKNSLLNAAFRKRLSEIQIETSLSVEEISSKLLTRYSNNRVAQTDVFSAVKFFKDMDSGIFTDCDECGWVNAPSWSICERCGASSDDN